MPDHPLLEVTDLRVRFRTGGGRFTAVDGLSFSVRPGEVLGVVGESGSGKSVSMLGVLRLIRTPNAEISGNVIFRGRDLLALRDREMRAIRGREIAEQIRAHEKVSRRAARDRAVRLLDEVGIPAPGKRVDSYPHEFSGGQRQRIGIARAIALSPRLVVADEPVSALDVSVQAQVLNLFADLQEELGLTYVFIAHDLGVVRHVSDRIAVMYLGEIVEVAEAEALYAAPAHPYTHALLSAVPEIDDGSGAPRRERVVLTGDVPSPIDRPTGCSFHPRCPAAQARCRTERPPLNHAGGRQVACHFPLTSPIGVGAGQHGRL